VIVEPACAVADIATSGNNSEIVNRCFHRVHRRRRGMMTRTRLLTASLVLPFMAVSGAGLSGTTCRPKAIALEIGKSALEKRSPIRKRPRASAVSSFCITTL
jgi:hypothetical protein